MHQRLIPNVTHAVNTHICVLTNISLMARSLAFDLISVELEHLHTKTTHGHVLKILHSAFSLFHLHVGALAPEEPWQDTGPNGIGRKVSREMEIEVVEIRT